MSVIQNIIDSVSEAINAALRVNLLDMIIQFAATIILVLIVKHFFWGRITDYLEKRKTIMDENFKEAKVANEEAARLKEQREKDYHDLKVKSKEYIETAKKRGEEERQAILGKAKNEADNLMQLTHKEVAAEKARAESQIKKEIVDLATLMAGKIIKQEIDEDKYQDMAVEDVERSEEV